MNKKQREDLETLLVRSRFHAEQCTIDNGITHSLIMRQNEPGYLTLSVSSGMISRATELYRKVIRRMDREGFSITTENDAHYRQPPTALVVDGEVIPIRIKEPVRLKEIPWGDGTRKAFVPTGQLSIDIFSGTSCTPNREVRGRTFQEVMAQLDALIPYLRRAAVRIRKARLKASEWKREQEEKERIQREHSERIEERLSVARHILKEVALFRKAESIRDYCDRIEQRISDPAFLEKVSVARAVADWIDPTVDYVDSLLSEKMAASDIVRLLEL